MDWADDKAREWLHTQNHDVCSLRDPKDDGVSLAALLREQKAGYANSETGAVELAAMERARVLAEVRRVVEEFMADVDAVKKKGLISEQHGWGRRAACLEILSRLEALK